MTWRVGSECRNKPPGKADRSRPRLAARGLALRDAGKARTGQAGTPVHLASARHGIFCGMYQWGAKRSRRPANLKKLSRANALLNIIERYSKPRHAQRTRD